MTVQENTSPQKMTDPTLMDPNENDFGEFPEKEFERMIISMSKQLKENKDIL